MSDFSDTFKIAERLKSSTEKLHKLANDCGHARQIKEFCSDMKRNLLAKYMVGPLKEGQSAAAAEVFARANENYQREFQTLTNQYETAERVIASWGAEMANFDASRSLLAMSRETMRQLEG